MLFRPGERYQMPQPDGLDLRDFHINALGRIEIKGVVFGVMEPFARRVEFLKNVFDKPEMLVRAFVRAVVLPPPFQLKRPIGFFVKDSVMHAPPQGCL